MDSIPLRYEATHTRLDGKRDGKWYRTNSGNLSLSKECTILCYKRLKRGTKMAEIFDSVDHPIFSKVFALNQKKTYTEVVIEKLPSMELTHWLDNHSILWTENNEKTQYLEMEAQHQQLFKSILEGLYRLHEQKRCHGNLLCGVWVSEDGDPKFQVKFADMNLDAGSHDGFLKDFEDLKTLVRRVVNKHDEHISTANEKCIQSPPALDHFYTLYNKFKQHANSSKLMGHGVKPSEKDADQMAMEDFLWLFPEAIPCIFDRLIKAFHPSNSNFQFGDLPERGIYSSLKQCFVFGERCIGQGGLESQDFGDDHNFLIYFP
ncbi:unnamed protein product [Camellia sinensis]